MFLAIKFTSTQSTQIISDVVCQSMIILGDFEAVGIIFLIGCLYVCHVGDLYLGRERAPHYRAARQRFGCQSTVWIINVHLKGRFTVILRM